MVTVGGRKGGEGLDLLRGESSIWGVVSPPSLPGNQKVELLGKEYLSLLFCEIGIYAVSEYLVPTSPGNVCSYEGKSLPKIGKASFRISLPEVGLTHLQKEAGLILWVRG